MTFATQSPCPVCGERVTSYESETQPLEQYADGSIDEPGRLGKVPQRAQRVVPGPTVEKFGPCGCERRS